MKKRYTYNRFSGTDIVVNESMRGAVEKLNWVGASSQTGTPTPDSPKPIYSAGDEGKIAMWSHKKNMFDGNYTNGFLNGTTGVWTTDSTTRTAIIRVNPSTQYSVNKFINTGIGTRFTIAESPTILSSGGVTTVLYSNAVTTKQVITTGATAKYLYIYVTNDTNSIPYLMVTQNGSIEASYEPYIGSIIPISLPNKNILGKEGLSTPATDTNFWDSLSQIASRGAYPQSDGWIKIQNLVTTTTETYINLWTKYSALMNLKTNTLYTIFYEVRNKNNVPNANILALSDGSTDVWTANIPTINLYNAIEGNIYSVTATTISSFASAVRALRSFVWVEPNYGVYDFEFRIWIVEGDQTATPIPYEPYVGYIGGSLPNGVADTDTQKKIGKVVLNGSESDWQSWTSGTNTIGFRLLSVSGLKSITSASTEAMILATHFTKSASQNALTGTDAEGFATTVSNLYFRINKTRLATVDVVGFKTWLSSNNVTVHYELATPENITITKPLVNTYEGANTITTTNNVKPSLTIEAWKR